MLKFAGIVPSAWLEKTGTVSELELFFVSHAVRCLTVSVLWVSEVVAGAAVSTERITLVEVVSTFLYKEKNI